jgi:fimbrial chaperone protein
MLQLRTLPVLLTLLVASYATAAWGSVVAVNPVRIHLSGAKRSEQLKLTNNGARPARFQVTAFSWHETPAGEMKLLPTTDLLFFPSLLEIAPGQTRRVRVGSTVPPGRSELSYRIIVEELPPAGATAGIVRVLTRLNVPVFVQPKAARPKPALKTRIERGQIFVSLENGGNAYFKATELRVIARSKSGTVLLDKMLAGWYVLAFGRRDYSLVIPKDICTQALTVTTTATTEQGATRAVSQVPADAGC